MNLQCVEGVITLGEKITFSNVVGLRRQGEQLMQKNSHVQFDFLAVRHHDSSMLSLLFAWKRFAKRCNSTVLFVHLPSSLKALAAVCNVKNFL